MKTLSKKNKNTVSDRLKLKDAMVAMLIYKADDEEEHAKNMEKKIKELINKINFKDNEEINFIIAIAKEQFEKDWEKITMFN